MMRRSASVLVALARALLIVLCVNAQAAGAEIVVVTSERTGAYLETQEALVADLRPELGRGEVEVLDVTEFDATRLGDARLVVTIGTQAAKTVAARRPSIAVLHTLLPRNAFEGLPALPQSGKTSAVFLDQPEQRQLALLAAALPELPRIALLVGPQSEQRILRMVEAARQRRMQVAVERVNDEKDIYPALERLLQDSPVLIAQPDGRVFNSYTIQNILLTSYRHRTPLIGFSPAYVKAGALLALYSTPAQIGRQAAGAVRSLLAGRGLPPPQGPQEFEVDSNPVVARALGIALEPPATIAARMREREFLGDARQ